MKVDCIPFKNTGYFSSLISDYLDENKKLKPFYNRFPKIEEFRAQIEEKSNSYPQTSRKTLNQVLQEQYQGVKASKSTLSNISALSQSETFTVATGHQLNIFTGPLYFLYKIISTINLAKALKKAYPRNTFVPVYWMATEDHDFDEINYFNLHNKKLQWNRDSSGAVGRLSTKGLEAVFDTFSKEVGHNTKAETLKNLFKKAYLEHNSLSEATRYLANSLFGEYGLVIVDGDDLKLKNLFAPYIKNDILENQSFTKVNETIAALESVSPSYNIQVNPREINHFYLKDGLRERLLEKEDLFYVNNTDIKFTKDEIMMELDTHPERFSPNVVTRPIYQEVVLPNLCYIGGGGELAYWLELKSSFDAIKVPFPILLLRNSALMISEKENKKIKKLDLIPTDLFLKQNSLINKRIREISNIDIDFSSQREHLSNQFEALYLLAEETDKSFLGAVKAQEVKQLNGLNHLEKRLLKAQKLKLKDQVVRLTALQNQLFPNQSLQERSLNFSELYLELGDKLIPFLLNALNPLKQEFLVLKY
ncbi:bacillithiol biosynthesis cysteine-adding enzyme BshC [uncultured Eudoraea sp.]|uniref:bacillithiol biosynthesis cysteine-adding enzyme BshC n=1 Tax=uncultured Eudoraea sp. TaxID=1035614 RepID=UPI0026251E20|nr:bacillithiol biosynthesis cysteine-adding enzyme BshC [uncultured Eudoraea sp.]